MRDSRGMIQRKITETSRRAYLPKPERGQSGPTLAMVITLNVTLPVTLIALTLSAESRQPSNALVGHLDKEVRERAKRVRSV